MQFGHHEDPVTDFLTELEIIESEITDRAAGLPPMIDNLPERLERAMQFDTSASSGAAVAKSFMRFIAAAMKVGAEQAAEAGWQAALKCHSERSMAGWSSHKDEYLQAALNGSKHRPPRAPAARPLSEFPELAAKVKQGLADGTLQIAGTAKE